MSAPLTRKCLRSISGFFIVIMTCLTTFPCLCNTSVCDKLNLLICCSLYCLCAEDLLVILLAVLCADSNVPVFRLLELGYDCADAYLLTVICIISYLYVYASHVPTCGPWISPSVSDVPYTLA